MYLRGIFTILSGEVDILKKGQYREDIKINTLSSRRNVRRNLDFQERTEYGNRSLEFPFAHHGAFPREIF